MVVLDTSIIIDHLRTQNTKATVLENITNNFSPSDLYISVITVQELFIGQSTKIDRKLQDLNLLLNALKCLEYDSTIAEYAGKIQRDTTRIVTFPDAAIAATTILNGFQLATLNTKDFLAIKNLRLLQF